MFNTTSNYTGLFGYVNGRKISNLGLAGVNIKGGEGTGGVAGTLSGTGASITGCYVSGEVIGGQSTGGIVGRNEKTVNNCYATGAISGTNECGGIVGINYGGAVNNNAALMVSARN